MKRKYYTDGYHECRLGLNDKIPPNYHPGRLRPSNSTKDTIKITDGKSEKHWNKNIPIPDG